MVEADEGSFLPSTLASVLEAINTFSPDEVSVIDTKSNVYGALANDETLVYPRLHPPQRVEVWLGADHEGISTDTPDEMLTFLQGFLNGLLFFPTHWSVDKLRDVLNQLPSSYTSQLNLLAALHSQKDVSELLRPREPDLPDSVSATQLLDEIAKQRYSICIEAGEFQGMYLFRGRLYETLPDDGAKQREQVRVVDESGGNFLYPTEWFLPVDSTEPLRQALLQVG